MSPSPALVDAAIRRALARMGYVVSYGQGASAPLATGPIPLFRGGLVGPGFVATQFPETAAVAFNASSLVRGVLANDVAVGPGNDGSISGPWDGDGFANPGDVAPGTWLVDARLLVAGAVGDAAPVGAYLNSLTGLGIGEQYTLGAEVSAAGLNDTATRAWAPVISTPFLQFDKTLGYWLQIVGEVTLGALDSILPHVKNASAANPVTVRAGSWMIGTRVS